MRNGKDHEHDNIGTTPLTGEIGSEGGSYADASQQRATRTGDLDEAEAAEPETPPGAVSAGVDVNPDEPEDGVRPPHRPRTPHQLPGTRQ
jgi:hypothetical protein